MSIEINTIAKPTKRIEWIDALRGFTMILVVFSHVELFTFEYQSSFINEVFMSFRMPLFFFISGFIGYKANVEWNARTWWTMSKKKILIQLIPTFVFGLIFAYAYCKVDFWAFITNFNKLGYWFTLVLLEMFLLIYTMNLILHKCGSKEIRFHKVIALLLLYVILFVVELLHQRIPSSDEIYNILTLHYVYGYFPYFALGYICSMYKEVFNKIVGNRYFAAVVIPLFSLSFYVNKMYILPNLGGGFLLSLSAIGVGMTIGTSGLLIVYNTFRTYSESFSSDKKVGRALQYIGKRTLDIYLLHYFFLPYLPQVGSLLSKGNNATLELALGGGLSLLVIGVCLIVSNILRTTPIFAEYLFGVKRK